MVKVLVHTTCTTSKVKTAGAIVTFVDNIFDCIYIFACHIFHVVRLRVYASHISNINYYILCGTLLIWIYRYYLGMRCIYAYILLLVYVMQARIYIHLGMLFSFRYNIYIYACSFHLSTLYTFRYALFILLTFGMLFPSEYTIYISVCFFNLGILPCALRVNTRMRLHVHRLGPATRSLLRSLTSPLNIWYFDDGTVGGSTDQGLHGFCIIHHCWVWS